MSGSHAYGGDCPGLSGAHHYGGGGLGVLGALLAAEGDDGAGYIRASLAGGGVDDAKEYYGLITEIPAGLTIDTDEDGGFTASANDGVYVLPWDLYEWGAYDSASTFSVTFGVGTFLVAANLTGGSSISTGAVTVSPPTPNVVNLAAAGLVGGATISSVAVTVLPASEAVTEYPGATIPEHRMLAIAVQNRIARF